MEWITWSDDLSLGNEKIDGDHQKLVAIINQLADSVMNPSPQDNDAGLLDDLLAQTVDHFAEEDRLMASHAYPDAEAHMAEHAKLIKIAFDTKAEFEADMSTSVALLRFLRKWLTQHIRTADKALEDYLAHKRE